MKLNPDGKTVAAVDCLVPGIGEIIGGSQREDDYEKLLARMNELGLKPEDYDFYLDLRKYGSTRHAGFGLGSERCVMYLTGMSNIRDVIPFPRTVNNCDFIITWQKRGRFQDVPDGNLFPGREVWGQPFFLITRQCKTGEVL